MTQENGTTVQRPLLPGIYCPTVTFFDPETEDLDIPSIRRHAVRLAEAGLAGIVTQGSNGEAVHLSLEEKRTITQETRKALDEAGYPHIPIMVGASENSIRGTIALAKHSKEAGGDYILLIPPSYYRYAMDERAITEYFLGVADGSPLPIVLYNYPGAVAGIDMDSDLLIKLSQHPNIVGTKFTCANTGKLARVALAMDAATPNSKNSGYMCFAGMADFLLQALTTGACGVIAGGANVMPKLCVKVFDLFKEGKLEEARETQMLLSKGDWVLTKAAIPGTKSACESYYGYGGYPRRPLRRLEEEQVKAVKDNIADAMKVELSL